MVAPTRIATRPSRRTTRKASRFYSALIKSVLAFLLVLYLVVLARVLVLQEHPKSDSNSGNALQRERQRLMDILYSKNEVVHSKSNTHTRGNKRQDHQKASSDEDLKSSKNERKQRDLPHAAIRSHASNNVKAQVRLDSDTLNRGVVSNNKKQQQELEHAGRRNPPKVPAEDTSTKSAEQAKAAPQLADMEHGKQDTTLRAYLEPIHQEDWEIKPLPIRTTASANQLTRISYPRVNSCSRLIQQFPVDDYPEDDPFLPWIHDVFPTHDGKRLQFVAQNKRRCHTGKTTKQEEILKHTQPQVALFQHVPIKRIISKSSPGDDDDSAPPRYKLCSHKEADEDGVETRFICRFKQQTSIQETLSVHNVHYDYAAYRKGFLHTFSKEGRDNKSIHTSQLIFYCPIPDNLQKMVREGTSVVNDYATLFVDLVPIRTPPRYGPPNIFFPPRYKQHQMSPQKNANWTFDASIEWGDNHVLPRVEDSGRWENIPICKPSLLQYESSAITMDRPHQQEAEEEKPHELIACVWASSGYRTRGERFAVNDGQRRLKEWLAYNFLVDFDHVYVYDNSAAQEGVDVPTLKPVTDQFSESKVTRIDWPHHVCNNRKNNVDSPGERSSQYAAEASCRLRFGPHTQWIGGFDIDEYLVPMGNYTSLKQILNKLNEEGNKILSFASWRAWPRKSLIEEPNIITDPMICGQRKPCFHVEIPSNQTILQTYNCDRQKGQKKEVMPAEKQLYRPDYVLQHFVHFSTITKLSQMSKAETKAARQTWKIRIGQDPKLRFTDEINEGTMLHAKAVATQDTADWLNACKGQVKGMRACRIGFPYPEDASNVTTDEDGWVYNCFVNQNIENQWVPKLEQAMASLQHVDPS